PARPLPPAKTCWPPPPRRGRRPGPLPPATAAPGRRGLSALLRCGPAPGGRFRPSGRGRASRDTPVLTLQMDDPDDVVPGDDANQPATVYQGKALLLHRYHERGQLMLRRFHRRRDHVAG